MTRAKICGMTSRADVAAAADAGADAVGLIVDVSVDTPREVSADTAATLAAAVPPFVSTVLVTMATPATADDLADDVGADAVQLHGTPDPDAVAALDRPTLLSVDADDPDTADRYADVADALLVDSVDEAGAGGTGRTHDWTATRAVRDRLDVPVVLAGGLTPENVATAVDAVAPYAVDVASGVEHAPGETDPEAARAFVRNAARATVNP